jgi:maltooligosyltrehalose trehalohydrolase
MGATPTPEGVHFRVWAPTARTAEVELPETDQVFPMQRDDDGVWSTLVPDLGPGTRYVYRLDGQLRRPDPYSRSQPDGVHGPSDVVDPNAYAWHDRNWHGLRIQGLVIYQVHVGTATPEGTLDSLIGEFPRLRRLGVNAVQLLPLYEFPGARNWGYDGVDMFAVSRNYGGPEAFRRLVDAAHTAGLGVIVDVIYNHFGPDGNYLRDFSADYFNERHHTPWGAAVNYDGAAAEWVRKLVIDNARFWVREYHVDGLRVDATHEIYDVSQRHILAEVTQAARAEAASERDLVLIAETGENDVRYVRGVEEGGFGFDAVYADDFHHALRRYLAGDHEGYYADFEGTLDEVARCIQRGWLYEGQGTLRSKGERRRGTPADNLPAWHFLYALQNHDQVGNRAFGERLHHQIGLERFAAASALLLFLPYTPMLFMGQEFGASSPFLFFTDHHPELGRLVTEGRRREFQAFSTFAEPASRERIPNPQAESTFQASKLPLAEAELPPGSDLLGWYAALLRLRQTDPVLLDQARERLSARAVTDDVLLVRRWSGRDERLLVVNFGNVPFQSDEFRQNCRVILGADNTRVVPPRRAAIFGRSSV